MRRCTMQSARAILATVAILGLLAVPALAKKTCNNNNIVEVTPQSQWRAAQGGE